ncbi:uncharacterized protein LOC115644121 [Gopherus evgoodei]|uniref:uncharacterized protein LOC115644121 n=1 Tax=Gopherus evgoodei TaxID=1825980 RepID=UPI0011CFD003|nr:uncharacterized protein LOC115644121 [Gopherus evgoodei]
MCPLNKTPSGSSRSTSGAELSWWPNSSASSILSHVCASPQQQGLNTLEPHFSKAALVESIAELIENLPVVPEPTFIISSFMAAVCSLSKLKPLLALELESHLLRALLYTIFTIGTGQDATHFQALHNIYLQSLDAMASMFRKRAYTYSQTRSISPKAAANGTDSAEGEMSGEEEEDGSQLATAAGSRDDNQKGPDLLNLRHPYPVGENTHQLMFAAYWIQEVLGGNIDLSSLTTNNCLACSKGNGESDDESKV